VSISVAFLSFALFQQSVGTDYAFPLGIYSAAGATVGDATGGAVSLNHDYSGGYIYSLEGISATKGTVAADVRIDWLPQIDKAGTGFVVVMNLLSGSASHGVQGADGRLWWPLSHPHPSPGAAVRAGIEFDVNTNTEVYRAALWGYYWDFRAVRTPTGPVRPR